MKRWMVAVTMILALGLLAGCGGEKQDGGDGEMQQDDAATTQTDSHGEGLMNSSDPMPDLTGLDLQDGPQGLQYAVLKEGDGAQPQSGQRVSVHYVGWFKDSGQKFDSSFDHPGGNPFSFALGQGQVIRGWDLGVGMMQVGDRHLLVLPYDLAYGERGHPAGIPPRSDLVFDVELLSVQ